MEHDLHNSVSAVVALTSQSITTNTTTNGATVDTAGFESLDFQIISGALNAGTFTAEIEESPDDGAGSPTGVWTAVDSELVLGAAVFADTEDNTVKRIGTISKERFVRLTIVSTGASGANILAGVAVLGDPQVLPTT